MKGRLVGLCPGYAGFMQKATAFGRGSMGQLLAGMSPGLGVSQVPRLRTETHFGVQARALPAGLQSMGLNRKGGVCRPHEPGCRFPIGQRGKFIH